MEIKPVRRGMTCLQTTNWNSGEEQRLKLRCVISSELQPDDHALNDLIIGGGGKMEEK